MLTTPVASIGRNSDGIEMVRLKAASFVDNISNPEPAALMNELGVLATAGDTTGASRWYIAAQVPVDPYVQFLIDRDDVSTTVLSLRMANRSSGLLLALQLGNWQYRLVLPLLGPTVEVFLQSLDRKTPTVNVELFAQELESHSRRFAVPMSEGQLDESLQSLLSTSTTDVGSVRRDLGQMCMSAAVPKLLPPAGGWKLATTITMGRVMPPELLAMRHDDSVPGVGQNDKS